MRDFKGCATSVLRHVRYFSCSARPFCGISIPCTSLNESSRGYLAFRHRHDPKQRAEADQRRVELDERRAEAEERRAEREDRRAEAEERRAEPDERRADAERDRHEESMTALKELIRRTTPPQAGPAE